MQGELIYNASTQRLDIKDPSGNEYGGLHCGNVIDVMINGNWIPARVEHCNDWSLIPLFEFGQIPCGLRVRI